MFRLRQPLVVGILRLRQPLVVALHFPCFLPLIGRFLFVSKRAVFTVLRVFSTNRLLSCVADEIERIGEASPITFCHTVPFELSCSHDLRHATKACHTRDRP